MIYDDITQAIIDNDALPQSERQTNVSLANEYNTTETTIRRRRRAIKREGGISEAEALRKTQQVNDEFFKDIPQEAITSRGKSVRLEDGSWEKISYSPAKVAALQALNYDDVLELVKSYAAQIPNTPMHEGTLVVCAADFQTGKVGSGGTTNDLVKRVLSCYAQMNERYDTIIYADLGDIVENFNNTAQQAQTNDLSLTDQIRVAQLLTMEGLKHFAPLCNKLIYVAVPSNHCQVRNGIGAKQRANAPADDLGLMIQDNIMMALSDRPDFAHVEYEAPERWEEAVTIILRDGTGVGFTHGDLAGSINKVPEWFARLSHGHRSDLDKADVLVTGHFHSPAMRMSGNGRWVITAPSIDNGSDWFTNKSGESNPPAILSFEAGRHNVRNWVFTYPVEEG